MRYGIIGNGPAGNAAADAIFSKDPEGRIIIISDEPHYTYYRPLITGLIDEKIKNIFFFKDKIKTCIERRLGQKAEDVDSKKKLIILKEGEQIPYDRLLIAAGSSVFIPEAVDFGTEGVYKLRTLDDAEAVRKATEEEKDAVILGGGQIGVKAALALKEKGLNVSIVEIQNHVLSLQLDETAGKIIDSALESLGIRLILGQSVKKIIKSNNRISGVKLDDGRELKAEILIAATGTLANKKIAETAGISVNKGIVVDRFLRTNIPDIYAAGDAAEIRNIITGRPMVSRLFANAVEMGAVAGKNMTGGSVEYEGALDVLNSMEVANIPVISIGLINPPPDKDFKILSVRRKDKYRKLVLKEGILVGALLVGDIRRAGIYTGLIKKGKIKAEPYLKSLAAQKHSCADWIFR